MKTILRFLVAVLPALSPLYAQVPKAENSATSFQVEANLDIDPSQINFVPPPPPKPAPPMDVKSANVRQDQGRTLAIVRAEASTLPDVPEPQSLNRQDQRAYSGPHRKTYSLSCSVEIYDRKVSKVTCTDHSSKEKFEAWFDWDWSLVSPIQNIKGIESDYSLFFIPSHRDTIRKSPHFGPAKKPSHPPIPPSGYVLTLGENESEIGQVFAALQSFKDRNRLKLEALLTAREKYQADAALWRKANPRKPEDNTIWFKPHRGSRYLAKDGSTIEPQSKEEAR